MSLLRVVSCIVTGAFLGVTVVAMIQHDVATTVGSGLLALFWQREFHRDLDR